MGLRRRSNRRRRKTRSAGEKLAAEVEGGEGDELGVGEHGGGEAQGRQVREQDGRRRGPGQQQADAQRVRRQNGRQALLAQCRNGNGSRSERSESRSDWFGRRREFRSQTERARREVCTERGEVVERRGVLGEAAVGAGGQQHRHGGRVSRSRRGREGVCQVARRCSRDARPRASARSCGGSGGSGALGCVMADGVEVLEGPGDGGCLQRRRLLESPALLLLLRRSLLWCGGLLEGVSRRGLERERGWSGGGGGRRRKREERRKRVVADGVEAVEGRGDHS